MGRIDRCTPIVDGVWDNYGSVDVPQPPRHFVPLVEGLVGTIQARMLDVDFRACSRDPLAESDDTVTIFKKIVGAIEMDALDDGVRVVLLGKRLRLALIGAQVAKALVSEAKSESDLVVAEDLVDWKAANLLYGSVDESVSHVEKLRLLALQSALTKRGIEWKPSGSTITQFTRHQERIALQSAVGRFSGDTSIKGALVRYAQEEYFDD